MYVLEINSISVELENCYNISKEKGINPCQTKPNPL